MESNNIVTAPQVAEVEEFYEFWKRNHTGSLSSFYEFMTTPTPERDEFLTQWEAKTVFNGSIASVTLILG